MNDKIWELRNKAWELPRGAQKLAVMEEAIRVTDQLLTRADSYDIRMDYNDEAIESGFPERMFVTFAWCINELEQHPEHCDEHQVLWHYKWFLHKVWQFSCYDRSQLDKLFLDFKQKCERYGYELGPYYKFQHAYALARGDYESAKEFYKLWKASKRDDLSDCRACDQHDFGDHYIELGHYKRALQAMKPIFEERITCRSVPRSTYGMSLYALVMTEQFELAERYARKGLRSLKSMEHQFTNFRHYIEYYTAFDLPQAAKLVDATAAEALRSKIDFGRLEYFLVVRQFFEVWQQKKRRRSFRHADRMCLPWLETETERLIQLFVERDGESVLQRVANLRERMQNMLRLAASKL